MQFELAALYRDRLKAATQIAAHQKIVSTQVEDVDYVGLAQDERTGDTAVQVLFVRRGRLIGRETFMLEGAEAPQADVNQQGVLVEAFIQRFYDNATLIPKLILVQAMPDGQEVLGKLAARSPRLESRTARAAARAEAHADGDGGTQRMRVSACAAGRRGRRTPTARPKPSRTCRSRFSLERPPTRIECFDVSTLHGTNTVGSMVVFAKGVPQKRAYKRFKIRGKGSQGEPDDYASMREMLRRRFRRIVEDDERQRRESPQTQDRRREPGASCRTLSSSTAARDSLGVAVEVLTEFDLLDQIPVVGLAKREEEIFRPGRPQPIWLERAARPAPGAARTRRSASICHHLSPQSTS